MRKILYEGAFAYEDTLRRKAGDRDIYLQRILYKDTFVHKEVLAKTHLTAQSRR